jgi:PIN domain nuclease of toxin-antitoxin system
VRFLLDTNVLVWSLAETLKPDILDALADPENELFVSDVSLWELAIKTGQGKLRIPADLDEQMERLEMKAVAMNRTHIAAYRELPPLHRDPFDRMLVAQAKVENLILVTRDRLLADYDITVLPC